MDQTARRIVTAKACRLSRSQGTLVRGWTWFLWGILGTLLFPGELLAADRQIFNEGQLDVRALLQAGGAIGYVIILLSVAMVALVVEHLLSIRKSILLPQALIDEVQPIIRDGHYGYAVERCHQHPSYLGVVLTAGLQESALGYSAVEKAMEDASVEQAARLMRKIDYLSLIGAVAPMLGLLGTVWGMIQAFAEFSAKANPQPADFAPSISAALVTTLFGLCVAIPASAAYVWFRNRIDEMVAEAALVAVHLTGPMKRALAAADTVRPDRPPRERLPAERPSASPRPVTPPVVREVIKPEKPRPEET